MESSTEPSANNEIVDVHAELVHPLTEFDESRDCWEIPLCANSWLVNPGQHAVITSCGLGNWIEHDVVARVFFHVKETVKLELALRCKVPEGSSLVEANVLGVAQALHLQGQDYRAVPVGKFRIFGSGYVKVDLKGLTRTGGYFADVSHLMVAKKDLPDDAIYYIKGEDREETYWHRRGPSLHLKYKIPDRCGPQEYYYNEVTVPKGYDMVGSYFMAIGFDGGYFGIQVNGPEERRVLFSVWSPQETDDPDAVTEDNAVLAVNQGDDVHVEVFGNEGSGGKSYLLYDWSPDVTYKFLVRGRPDPMLAGYSIFSAWFGERSTANWRLICEFSRPKTDTHLTSFYSFIENFDQDEGSTCRKCYFNNQWTRDTAGHWHEITEARISGDGTAEGRVRLDFEGGVEQADQAEEGEVEEGEEGRYRGFYLKHCGFFVGACNLLSVVARPPMYNAPCTMFRYKKRDQHHTTPGRRNLTVELVDDGDEGDARDTDMFEISLYANGWVVDETAAAHTPTVITTHGVGNWMTPTTEIHAFFFVRKPVKARLYMRCKVPEGTSRIGVEVCGVERTVTVRGDGYRDVYVGRYRFLGRDYAKVVLRCVVREGAFIADVSHLLMPMEEVGADAITCIEHGSVTQEMRKGPSVFLHYAIPERYVFNDGYYVEVAVDREDCPPGSKIVAIGFDGGSVGIQDGDKIFFTIVTDDGSSSDCELHSDRSYLVYEAEDTTTDYALKEGGVQVVVQCTTPLTWPAGGSMRCRFLVRAWPDPELLGFSKYAVWYCSTPSTAPGATADTWRMVAELRNRCSLGYISGFYSGVACGGEEAGLRGVRAVVAGQTVRKTGREVHQVVRGAVRTAAGARADCDAAVVDTADGGEGFALRAGGFLAGGGHLDGAVLARRSDDAMPQVPYSNLLVY